MRGGVLGLLLALPLAAVSTASAAEPEDVIKYRQAVMKSVGGHMGALSQIIRGKVDYADDLAYHAQAVAHSMKRVPALFPEDSDFGDTRALAAIWEDGAAFERVSSKAAEASAALAEAVRTGDTSSLADRFKDLGESCKACHEDFREEE